MTQNAFFEKQVCLICLIHLRMATHWACRNIIIYFLCHGMLTNIKLDLCLLLSYLCEPNINALCHHWLALKKILLFALIYHFFKYLDGKSFYEE